MPRLPKPYFRRSHGTYHATIAGKVVNLGTADAAQAWRVFCERQAAATGGQRAVNKELTYLELATDFLLWSRRNLKPATFEEHRRYVGSFAKFVGPDRQAISIIPNDLTTWIDKLSDGEITVRKPAEIGERKKKLEGNQRPFGAGGKRAAIVAVKRSFNWAADERIIDASPIHRVKVARSKRRGRVLSESDQAALIAAMKPKDPFRDFLALAFETGMRPDELYRLSSRHIHGKKVVFEEHEAKGGIERKVVLTGAALEIIGRLTKLHPAGPILRNTRGEPWTRESVSSRMWRLKKAGTLPPGISAYSLRHSFATTALENGVNPEALRVMLGHSSLDMISRHYSHLDQNDGHLRQEVERARGNAKSIQAPSPPPASLGTSAATE